MTRLLASLAAAVLVCAVLLLVHRTSHNGQTQVVTVAVLPALTPALALEPPISTDPDPRRVTGQRRTPHRIPAVWRHLAACESNGRWGIVNPPYSGGLQFMARTWRSFHGTDFAPTADQATRWQQVVVARRVQRRQGWAAWPVCSVKVGLR